MVQPRYPTLFRIARLAFTAYALSPASAAGLSVTDPTYGKVNANALDQPRLHALVSDPAAGDAFRTWLNPESGAVEPVLLSVFVDTGASGFALSHLHATGELEVGNLALQPADYLGPFTEIGIGGTELGDVSRPLGIWVSDTPYGSAGELQTTDFTHYGDFSLWVRRETGTGEYNELLGADPINLVGMPVIRQRRLHLDFRPMVDLAPIAVRLLPPAAAEPPTQATVPLVLRDFIGTEAPPGEVLPSHYANPLVPGVTLRHAAASSTGEWLLDTGAGSSFASFAQAQAAGLIPAHHATLADFMATYTGRVAQVGGIGAALTVPILTVDRIEIPTREGLPVVWENVDLLIADVAGLDGIFGMNLLAPAVTLDTSLLAGLGLDDADPAQLAELYGLLFALLFDISPGAFTDVVIDTTDAADPVMRLATPYAAGTVLGWLAGHFSAAERRDPSLGTLAADPDGDGLPNLLEYALRLDPRVPNPSPLSLATGAQRLRLTFPRRADPGLRYSVQASPDLATWTEIWSSSGPANLDDSPAVEDTTPLTASGRRFLRLHLAPAP